MRTRRPPSGAGKRRRKESPKPTLYMRMRTFCFFAALPLFFALFLVAMSFSSERPRAVQRGEVHAQGDPVLPVGLVGPGEGVVARVAGGGERLLPIVPMRRRVLELGRESG